MSQAKIKRARPTIFEYNQAKKRALPPQTKAQLAGNMVVIFPIVREEEKTFLDRCVRDPEYPRKYYVIIMFLNIHGAQP